MLEMPAAFGARGQERRNIYNTVVWGPNYREIPEYKRVGAGKDPGIWDTIWKNPGIEE